MWHTLQIFRSWLSSKEVVPRHLYSWTAHSILPPPANRQPPPLPPASYALWIRQRLSKAFRYTGATSFEYSLELYFCVLYMASLMFRLLDRVVFEDIVARLVFSPPCVLESQTFKHAETPQKVC